MYSDLTMWSSFRVSDDAFKKVDQLWELSPYLFCYIVIVNCLNIYVDVLFI